MIFTVYFQKLAVEAKMPSKAYPGDAGWDLYSSRDQTVAPQTWGDIHTDLAMALPHGWYGHVMARSSTLRRHSLMIVDAVIDSGYRGEMFLQAYNPHIEPITVLAGARLAQLLILPVPQVTWQEVAFLTPSERNLAGFGSSGR